MFAQRRPDRRRFLGMAALSLGAAWIGTRGSVMQMLTAKPFRPSSASDLASLGGATAWLNSPPLTATDLRGKVVWLNFFASWCPPCQQETPILRTLSDTYRDRGLEVVGISVQETTASDVKAYADRYRLRYPIGFDGSGNVLREYRVFALPTQFFLDTNGVIQQVVSGPVDEQGARALIESMLPGGAPSLSASPAPS